MSEFVCNLGTKYNFTAQLPEDATLSGAPRGTTQSQKTNAILDITELFSFTGGHQTQRKTSRTADTNTCRRSREIQAPDALTR